VSAGSGPARLVLVAAAARTRLAHVALSCAGRAMDNLRRMDAGCGNACHAERFGLGSGASRHPRQDSPTPHRLLQHPVTEHHTGDRRWRAAGGPQHT